MRYDQSSTGQEKSRHILVRRRISSDRLGDAVHGDHDRAAPGPCRMRNGLFPMSKKCQVNNILSSSRSLKWFARKRQTPPLPVYKDSHVPWPASLRRGQGQRTQGRDDGSSGVVFDASLRFITKYRRGIARVSQVFVWQMICSFDGIWLHRPPIQCQSASSW